MLTSSKLSIHCSMYLALLLHSHHHLLLHLCFYIHITFGLLRLCFYTSHHLSPFAFVFLHFHHLVPVTFVFLHFHPNPLPFCISAFSSLSTIKFKGTSVRDYAFRVLMFSKALVCVIKHLSGLFCYNLSLASSSPKCSYWVQI